MAFTWRNSTDTAALTTSDFTSAATLTALLWWSRGAAGAGPSEPSLVRLLVEDPDNPGAYLTSGHPALDSQECQVRITGSLNPGSDAAFSEVLTGWTRLGTDGVLVLPPMRGDTAWEIEIRWVLSAGLAGSRIPFAYRLEAAEGSVPAEAVPAALLGDGIVLGIGDPTLTRFVEHVPVTPTGTPDDKVHIGDAAFRWLYCGGYRYEGVADVTLSQDDGDAATLTSGEEYWAVLTLSPSGGATTTKGSKATAGAALRPAQPADELYVAAVRVAYDAGGGAIATGDIASGVAADRFQPRAGTGLTVIVGTGRAWVARQWCSRTTETTVVVPANVTRYLWLESTAALTLTTTDVAPSAGALRIATVITDGSSVMTLTDTRASWWEPRRETLRLRAAGSEATGTAVDVLTIDRPLWLDRGRMVLRVASAGATGSTDVTIVRSRGGSESDMATGTIAAGGYDGVLSISQGDLQAGDSLHLDVDAITAGGTQGSDVSIVLAAHPY